MNAHDHANGMKTTDADPARGKGVAPANNRRAGLRRALKIVSLIILVPLLLLVLGAGILLYIYQGEQISNSRIDSEVQSALQRVIGEDYRVEIANTGVSLVSSSILSLTGTQVTLTRLTDNAIVAELDRVKVGLDPWSLFRGSMNFDELFIEGGRVDLAPVLRSEGGDLQAEQALAGIGRLARQVSGPFSDGTIEQIQIENLLIEGSGLGQNGVDEPLRVNSVLIERAGGGFRLNADMATNLSDPVLSAQWHAGLEGGGYELTAGIGPVNSLEFFSSADPIMALAEERPRGIGFQSRLRADIRIPFDASMNPADPFVKVQADGGELRIGREQRIAVNFAVANLRADLVSRQLIMEQGDFSLGTLGFSATGKLALSAREGPAQPLPLELSLSGFKSSDPQWNGSNGLSNVVLDGSFEAQERTLNIASLVVSDIEQNRLTGTGAVRFAKDVAPVISVRVQSANLPVAMLQNAWPYNLSPPLRRWLRNQMSGGIIENLDTSFDLAAGRLAELDKGLGFRPEEFSLNAAFRGVSLRTVGELPPLVDASGRLAVLGSGLSVTEGRGMMAPSGADKVKVDEAILTINDLFEKPPSARLVGRLSSPLPAMAQLADAKPLEVASRLALKPTALSGEAVTRIDVTFPLAGKVEPGSINWKADVELTKASSSEPLFNQKISNANVSISAVPTLISAKGTATINGFDASLDITEPINGGPPDKRSRSVSTTLTTKELASQGIALEPIVQGRLDVQIKTGADGKDRYEIDLKNADLSLPWISWSKGSGIASKASFTLEENNGTNTLRDFSVSGPTYQAGGTLAFNKAGLISASLNNVVLVRGDQFDIKVIRASNRYEITANGRSFDGRAIINQVVHGEGLSSESAGADVTLMANFGRLAGFNQQVMENGLVRYRTERGRLSLLQIKGALSGGLSTIDANSNGNRTVFNFESQNAGSALALVDLYRKMEGGALKAELVRTGNGPFTGGVRIRNFVVAGEERLQSLVAAPAENNRLQQASGKLRELNVQRVKFDDMQADIEKAENLFVVRDGRLRNLQIGLTFDGTIYNPNDQMSVRGTFMPLFSVSRLIGGIPIIGDILSNGRNSGLIGITYRLKGPADNPTILVNPISVIAPGIFREIFQFQE